MTEPEGLTRKKRVRAAHRGSVTRVINQVYENLGEADGPNVPRLRQQKLTLSGKLDVLSKLDNDLIELVNEEELDQEVEQADLTREKISLAIIDIDHVLGGIGKRVSDTSGATGGDTSAEATPEVGGETGRTPTEPTPGTTASTPPVGTGPTHTPDPVPPASVSVSTGPTPVASATTTTPPTTSVPSVATPQVKLPKLSLKRFNGDLTKWVTFWDSFEASIHRNPNLSSIDKFNYLNSFLESTAAESIAGLTLTAANYEEAVATLKKRFGNTQLIVNRHMDALLALSPITSHHDLKGLRRLYDAVEAHVRGLRALGVSADSYGGLLISILMSKLPPEIRLIISRELTEDWDMESVMKIIDREVDARERSSAAYSVNGPPKKPHHRGPSTTATFVASSSGHTRCVYCEREHQPRSCTAITDVNARREALRRSGRCYACLKKYHVSKDCRSSTNCSKCKGRHHISICPRLSTRTTSSSTTAPSSTPTISNPPNQPPETSQGSTSTMYVGAQVPVLLQTAKLRLCNPHDSSTHVEVRGILDSGSQRTYVTSRVRERLNLPTRRTESLCIKTFGTTEGRETACEVVELSLLAGNGESIILTALVIPFICNALTSQPIDHSASCYDHLLGLELADSATIEDKLEVDVLVGCDLYWSLVTGRMLKGRSGPTAIHTKVGWVLSGPADRQVTSVNLNLTATHALRIDSYPIYHNLDDRLRRFWELESLGIMKDEASVYEKFTQQISFDGQRYRVSLPWKENHPPLPDNFDLCRRRLLSLLKKLKRDPKLLAEYNAVIKDQLSRGIVQVVADPVPSGSGRTHYLPHHGVVRQDKATSKLRIVYDASARANGPSLNDCLYTGPKFSQSIFDILLRFRLHRVALAGDIEKAFLMVSINEKDRDSLRFLWTNDFKSDTPDVVTLRFTRVVFGVSSSPFLLNATINHHMSTYQDIDPSFVDRFLSSIYVDDVSLGSDDVASAYKLYLKSKSRLAEAGFNLRKFVTNSDELRYRISANEQLPDDQTTLNHIKEEDQSYAKGSLGSKLDEAQGKHKILGIQWDSAQDSLHFDVGEISHVMSTSEPTKRSVVSMATRFFDPLGVVSPVTVQFKMFFQQLCEAGVNWDDVLTGDLLTRWNQLFSTLSEAGTLVLPRCYLNGIVDSPKSFQLIGFCDASAKAYAAIVYLKLGTELQTNVHFLAAKTRVAPLGSVTIPRLELLSAFLLSKLIASVQGALKSELSLLDPVCYTDSRVALYWIQGCDQEWKQFVENRVISIRALVPPRCWKHCPGKENPADIPSRGMSASELSRNHLWMNGPLWLHNPQESMEDAECNMDPAIPEDCQQEMKRKTVTHTLVVDQTSWPHIDQLIDCEQFSSFHRLLRVTALVLKFVHLLRRRVHRTADPVSTVDHITASDIDQARTCWIRASQCELQQNAKFPLWETQFSLFVDDSQLWRCGGRMGKSDLPSSAQTPILLDKDHLLTNLIIMDAHRRVMHNGVKETLTELRSAYWLVRGRQLIRKLIHRCVICRKQEGLPYRGVPPPPLPEYRVRQSRPFCHTGVDFAGPLYIKPSGVLEGPKVWLCLYTCCATRAVHLDLVPDLNTTTFIRSFKRFSARRGIPAQMISDNGKTFKSAAKIINQVLTNPEVQEHFAGLRVEWNFNLERAPWWGGMFERMIKSTKRCLKKVIGRASLKYDELLTIVTEVESVLNSRPLSYIAMDDTEEPLTPSHLILGYRVLSLPDPPISDDPDYAESVSGLTRRLRHVMKTSERFWKRWKAEYLLELRESHRTRQIGRGVDDEIKEGEIVTVYDENHPRGLWRLGRVESIRRSSDGLVRGACVRVESKSGRPMVLRRPVQHLYPLEVRSQEVPRETPQSERIRKDSPLTTPVPDDVNDQSSQPSEEQPDDARPPQRSAAILARDRILGCISND